MKDFQYYSKNNFITAPIQLQPWLFHAFSLTDKLKVLSHNVWLKVLSHHWQPGCWWSRHQIFCTDSRILTRQILMFSEMHCCWYARTLIPMNTYKASTVFFDRLQCQSLGTLLFGEYGIKRLYGYVYPIDDMHIEYHWVSQYLSMPVSSLWVRLAAYETVEKKIFYVIEILLPALENVIDEST